MPSVALPQYRITPVVAGNLAAALGRTAGALELVVRRAVAHGVVDGDLIARMDRVHGDDRNLPVEAGIRLTTMIDIVRLLVGRQRGEIKPLLDLHGMPADILR